MKDPSIPGQNEIEIFGIKGNQSSLLKNKLEEALYQYQLPYQVKANYNVDEFIRAGLSSVPALKAGDKIIEHYHQDSLDETVQKVIDYIQVEEHRIKSIFH